MSRLTRLMAVACCAAPTAGCVHGVTYRMPMPNSLTLGTIRGSANHGEESARTASVTGDGQPVPVSVAGK